jgi:hypothetical protein
VSTPEDRRIRASGGLFYEDYKIQDQGDWFYLTALPYFQPIGPPTGYYEINGHVICTCGEGGTFVPGGVTSNNPNVRPLGDGYFNDITRGYTQEAGYTSVDYEVIPKTLTLTAGTRYSRNTTTEVGSLAGSFGCQLINNPSAPDPCLNRGFVNLDAEHLKRVFAGFRSRANLTWRAADDVLLYYTWSQGSRSGGFNRGLGTSANSPLYPGKAPFQTQARANGGWTEDSVFYPDSLTNNELGWKTNWWNERGHWNGALYQENWDHTQLPGLDNQILGNGVINGGNYRVRGLETSLSARVTADLTLEAGLAWNHTELIKEATFYWANGAVIDLSSLQLPDGRPLTNPAGTLGSPLAGAPTFQGNVRARYEVAFNSYDAFVQIGAVHQSHSLSSTDQLSLDLQGNSIQYILPSFTTFDGSLGAGKNRWLVQLFGQNLTDTRAQLYANYSLSYKAVTVNRPRTVGLRFSYKYASAIP